MDNPILIFELALLTIVLVFACDSLISVNRAIKREIEELKQELKNIRK